MAKVYLKIINDCLECPKIQWSENGDRLICENKTLAYHDEDKIPIPQWCPLKDYENQYIRRDIKI